MNPLKSAIFALSLFCLATISSKAQADVMTFDKLVGSYKITNCTHLNSFEPQPPDYYCHLKTITISRKQDKSFVLSYVDELGQPGQEPTFTEHKTETDKYSDVAKFTEEEFFVRWQRATDNKENGMYINEMFEFNPAQEGLRLQRSFTLYQGDRFKHLIWDYLLEPIE
jgi:ABC-type oligopeptide transport system substrate-binding subunit